MDTNWLLATVALVSGIRLGVDAKQRRKFCQLFETRSDDHHLANGNLCKPESPIMSVLKDENGNSYELVAKTVCP
jgi:hypothetical protein